MRYTRAFDVERERIRGMLRVKDERDAMMSLFVVCLKSARRDAILCCDNIVAREDTPAKPLLFMKPFRAMPFDVAMLAGQKPRPEVYARGATYAAYDAAVYAKTYAYVDARAMI